MNDNNTENNKATTRIYDIPDNIKDKYVNIRKKYL